MHKAEKNQQKPSVGRKVIVTVAQLIGIVIFILWGYDLITRGQQGILKIVREEAVAFWRAMTEYFVRNIGGATGPKSSATPAIEFFFLCLASFHPDRR